MVFLGASKMALSEAQQTKMMRIFNFMDDDSDGFVDEEDFHRRADHIAEDHNWAKGSAEHTSIRERLEHNWGILKQVVDSNHDDKISPDEWLQFCEHGINDPNQFGMLPIQVAQAFMESLDKEGTGDVSLDNFISYAKAHGADVERAKQAFENMDTDGDGHLTEDEMIAIIRHYILSEDDSMPSPFVD
jgi:Ca2+-binding EF-hand superfamily protein